MTVGVRSEDWEKARAMLDRGVRVVEMASEDAWVRDSGPTFIVKVRRYISHRDGDNQIHCSSQLSDCVLPPPQNDAQDEGDSREVRGVDWGFNAYGGIYKPYDKDELLARKILEVEGTRRYKAPLVMEGGSFHVDGEGTCLVSC